MAQDEGRPSATEKGKGKVDDLNGEKGKGGGLTGKEKNGKVVDGLPEGEFNGETWNFDDRWKLTCCD
jgi:hypothetical protein